MVGQPNLPRDVEEGTDLKGSSAGTPGLTPLDEQREASLADEGGATAAAAESQDLDALRRAAQNLPGATLEERRPETRGRLLKAAAAAAAAGAAGLIARRRRT